VTGGGRDLGKKDGGKKEGEKERKRGGGEETVYFGRPNWFKISSSKKYEQGGQEEKNKQGEKEEKKGGKRKKEEGGIVDVHPCIFPYLWWWERHRGGEGLKKKKRGKKEEGERKERGGKRERWRVTKTSLFNTNMIFLCPQVERRKKKSLEIIEPRRREKRREERERGKEPTISRPVHDRGARLDRRYNERERNDPEGNEATTRKGRGGKKRGEKDLRLQYVLLPISKWVGAWLEREQTNICGGKAITEKGGGGGGEKKNWRGGWERIFSVFFTFAWGGN